MTHEWSELQAMSDEELISAYNEARKGTAVGLAWYRDEILHRENRRATAAALEQAEEVRVITREIRDMTAEIRDLTKSVRWLTIVAVAATILALIVAIATAG